jgi:hypothetical protein
MRRVEMFLPDWSYPAIARLIEILIILEHPQVSSTAFMTNFSSSD